MTTDTDTVNRRSRLRHWCFTINNPTDGQISKVKQLATVKNVITLVAQIEVGEEQKTPHIQGYVRFKHARRFTAVRKILAGAHLEKCRNVEASIQYCQKEEGRIRSLVRYGLPQPLRLLQTLRPWQQELVDKLRHTPDDRSIHWYVDYKGGIGKTAIAKYLCASKEFNALYLTGKASDAKYALYSRWQENKTALDNLIIIFDYTRSLEQFVSYQSIEEIKNGIFMNSKYESGMCLFNSPWVIVFANFDPDKNRLSEDRWQIHHMNQQ